MSFKRKHPLTIYHQRMRFSFGSTSEEIAWEGERTHRIWMNEQDPSKALREWIGKHLKNEASQLV